MLANGGSGMSSRRAAAGLEERGSSCDCSQPEPSHRRASRGGAPTAMPDVAGFRAKFAAIVPSTNTIVEADFNHLFRVPGVTFHTGRMYIERPALDSNDAFARLLSQVDRAFETAVRDVMTCEPDYLVMGMSAPTFWGGREGTETDAGKNPADAGKWFQEALNFLCEYVIDQGYDLRFALEPKPNEPRGDIYLATVGHMLAFIETLDHPHMIGVNPEVAHEHMAGLNFTHAVAQAWNAGKLFHIDLNDQNLGRYDQDFRFGSHNVKQAFTLVKFLEDVGYDGPRHFDAHAYRSSDYEDVKAFARGCMRTYLILKEKAEQFRQHGQIQELLAQITADDGSMDSFRGGYSAEKAAGLKAHAFDRDELGRRGKPYEQLDQLVIELILGV